jgi:hypothetical protein
VAAVSRGLEEGSVAAVAPPGDAEQQPQSLVFFLFLLLARALTKQHHCNTTAQRHCIPGQAWALASLLANLRFPMAGLARLSSVCCVVMQTSTQYQGTASWQWLGWQGCPLSAVLPCRQAQRIERSSQIPACQRACVTRSTQSWKR